MEERLALLRKFMLNKGIDALVIMGTDPHNNEYVAERWQAVRYFTAFTGEANVLLTLDRLILWTDARYSIQAEQELRNLPVEIRDKYKDESLSACIYNMATELSKELVLGFDSLTMPMSLALEIKSLFASSADAELRMVAIADLYDLIWDNRPAIPCTPLMSLDVKYAGKSRDAKLQDLQASLAENNCDAILISALDEIAWLLNIRAEDIECNPLAISYLLVSQEEIRLYILKKDLHRYDEASRAVFEELMDSAISIRAYDEIELGLSEYLANLESPMWIDSRTLNYSIYKILDNYSSAYIDKPSPIALLKAIKNSTEIAGSKRAHFEDGLVMVCFFYWLEQTLALGESIDEYDAAAKIYSLRSKNPAFKGDSFDTISAYGKNAALPHYHTPEKNSAKLNDYSLYLCDCGAHYLYGTTDITRTVPLGPCSKEMKLNYTLVLKGHINLARAVFPRHTSGGQLDILARIPLWRNHRNFLHGTGHGVGAFLNVHEGPQAIRQNYVAQEMLPGMITSNEPGYYKAGEYGIRIENLLLCKECEADPNYLEFESLSLCYIDTSIVNFSLLSPDEIDWLNRYNERVYESLSPNLPDNISSWLKDKCKPVSYSFDYDLD